VNKDSFLEKGNKKELVVQIIIEKIANDPIKQKQLNEF